MHRTSSLRLMSLRLILPFLGSALLASAAAAQTTHFVSLSSVSFSPQDLVIDVGDTVQWDWVVGFHNVESGVNGSADGAFLSGAPVSPPATFSVTFDQTFLDANPRAGNYYEYYCVVHLPGMTATVKVRTSDTTASASFRNDAGGTNPIAYTALNAPKPGASFDATVDTTFRPGTVGSFLVGYATPIEFSTTYGVLLVNVADTSGVLLNEFGTGPLVNFSVAVPAEPTLCGFSLSTQGVVFGGGVTLTNAYDLVVGL
ncbi:MAG: plastocyanin [Planctomycetota bacterium]|jgi:plastocyanin